MKTSLIKKTARTFFLVQAVMLVTSCSNFLNIDNYFDDEFNIDSVFTNARYMEAYMWGAAAMFPDEAQTIRNGYTPGPMATDEGFNGLTGRPISITAWISPTERSHRISSETAPPT